jgi:hypothetical protein
MMALYLKLKKKYLSEGFTGVCKSAVFVFKRKASKNLFKFKAQFFFRFKAPSTFVQLPVENLEIQNFPHDEIYHRIFKNEYLILSEGYINFADSSEPGSLIWNRDFVAQESWSLEQWGVDIAIVSNRGDIKRPWEIGRLHQLVQLSLCYRSNEDEIYKKACLGLAATILKDFSAKNPHFYGPQWMCAMDVGIRISNILLAADIFGEDFSTPLQEILKYELKRHEFFIKNNLENKGGHVVNNHYLSNVVGLIFCAAHKKETQKSEIAALYEDLLTQIKNQFLPDGSNFENSTYYHRLSAELCLFALALCRQKFGLTLNKSLTDQLQKMREFSEALTDFENLVPQVGDNDSGHLFCFNPVDFEENDLQHLGLIAGLFKLIDRQKSNNIFTEVLSAYVNKEYLASDLVNVKNSWGDESLFTNAISKLKGSKEVQHYAFQIDNNYLELAKSYVFPDFGICLLKSSDFFMSIRSGYSATDFVGAHRHVDQLSLCIKTRNFQTARDPGSFGYTSDTKMRNIFRSAAAHQVPHSHDDGALSSLDVFGLKEFKGKCLYFGHKGFYGYYEGGLDRYYRLIEFNHDQILVYDWSSKDLKLERLEFNETLFCSRYGKLDKFELE